MSFDPEADANLYSHVLPASPETLRNETILAELYGGSPEDWICLIQQLTARFDEQLSSGEAIHIIEGCPESEGIFAGYYRVDIYNPDLESSDTPKIAVRHVYATPEQIERGFRVPEDGLFAQDSYDTEESLR